tara:strand:+ start:3212 stop:4042 length:831 start_codon:yes stop_codon:yes gene_type:complete
MRKEIYWKKALQRSKISIESKSLFPLKTVEITNSIYRGNDFIIRKLDLDQFKKRIEFGPKLNPFRPWDKILEIDKIGKFHQLILNKYPVQIGHILLITNNWKPQNGWLDLDDWRAIKLVNKDTNGLWFFNSSPAAGASQPHRHFQLLRREYNDINCPREEWFLKYKDSKIQNKKFKNNIIVINFNFCRNAELLYDDYLALTKKLGLGDPSIDKKPKYPYNLLITNKWIAIIKRKKDNICGFSINALGFAGYLLVTKYSDVNYLLNSGPEKLLENFV